MTVNRETAANCAAILATVNNPNEALLMVIKAIARDWGTDVAAEFADEVVAAMARQLKERVH